MSDKNDNLIKFPIQPKANFNPIPVNKLLLNADHAKLDEVIVLGMKDGEAMLFTSESDVGKIVWRMEHTKHLLLKSVVADRYIEIKEED